MTRLIQERKAHLEFIKSAQLLKEKKKREKEHILEGKRQLDQLNCAVELSKQDVSSLQTIQRSQEQQDRQFQDYHRQKITTLQEKMNENQKRLKESMLERDNLEKQC